MMSYTIRVSALVATMAVSAGCLTSSYTPTSRSRVSVVMHENAVAYVRDGRMHKHGFLGSGLIEAVKGSARAERAARNFYERLRDGLVAAVGGLVCSTVAAVVAAKGQIDADEVPGRSYDATKPLIVAGACLVVSFVGLFYAVGAQPYQYDAINIFNDEAERRSQAPGFGAPVTPTSPRSPASVAGAVGR